MGFLNRLKNLIRYATVSKAANNSNLFPTQQVVYKGKAVEVFTMFPYGLFANMDSAETLGLVFEVEGASDNKAYMGHTPFKRPKDLKEGEVAFYHPGTGTYIKALKGGHLEINTTTGASGNLTINTTDATINASGDVTADIGGNLSTTIGGNVTATVSGNVTADISGSLNSVSASATFDTASATFTGNVQIDGNLDVGGSTTLTAVTSNGFNISNTHIHKDTKPGSPTEFSGTVAP